MRVRFEMYKNGHGAGAIAECDLTPKKAMERFEELRKDAKCGWAELVAEDEEEGGYMKVIDTHDKITVAQTISRLI